MDTPTSKRKRYSADLEINLDPVQDPIQPEELKGFTCTCKPKSMNPDRVLNYSPQLPEKTHYFDSAVLVEARLDHNTYYAGFLKNWREVIRNPVSPRSLPDVKSPDSNV